MLTSFACASGKRGGRILDTTVGASRVPGTLALNALANLNFVKATNSLSGGFG